MGNGQATVVDCVLCFESCCAPVRRTPVRLCWVPQALRARALLKTFKLADWRARPHKPPSRTPPCESKPYRCAAALEVAKLFREVACAHATDLMVCDVKRRPAGERPRRTVKRCTALDINWTASHRKAARVATSGPLLRVCEMDQPIVGDSKWTS